MLNNNDLCLATVRRHISFLAHFVDFVAVPDGPNPAYEDECSHGLEEPNTVGTVVTLVVHTARPVVSLEASAGSWRYDIPEQNPIGALRPNGIYMIVTTHL